ELVVAPERDAELDPAKGVELGEEPARVAGDEARLRGDPEREGHPATELVVAAHLADRGVPAALEVELLVVAGAAEDAAILLDPDRDERAAHGERQPDPAVAEEREPDGRARA